VTPSAHRARRRAALTPCQNGHPRWRHGRILMRNSKRCREYAAPLVVSAWLLSLAVAALGQQQASPPFPSAARLTPVINATVSMGSTANSLRFRYTVSNLPQSLQKISIWGLRYDASLTPSVMASPSGWTSYVARAREPMIRWGALRALAPGGSDTGFEVEAASLPGIVQAPVVGLVGRTQLPAFPDGKAPADAAGTSILDNSVKVSTVGPVPIPGAVDPAAFLASIIALKETAFGLGWIDDSGMKASLDAKLSAAAGSIARGNASAARNQLQALLNEIDAPSGKHLTPEAIGLLKFNIQFLLSNM
jgi:FIMAH domain